jgi:hypothetical protein
VRANEDDLRLCQHLQECTVDSCEWSLLILESVVQSISLNGFGSPVCHGSVLSKAGHRHLRLKGVLASLRLIDVYSQAGRRWRDTLSVLHVQGTGVDHKSADLCDSHIRGVNLKIRLEQLGGVRFCPRSSKMSSRLEEQSG